MWYILFWIVAVLIVTILGSIQAGFGLLLGLVTYAVMGNLLLATAIYTVVVAVLSPGPNGWFWLGFVGTVVMVVLGSPMFTTVIISLTLAVGLPSLFLMRGQGMTVGIMRYAGSLADTDDAANDRRAGLVLRFGAITILLGITALALVGNGAMSLPEAGLQEASDIMESKPVQAIERGLDILWDGVDDTAAKAEAEAVRQAEIEESRTWRETFQIWLQNEAKNATPAWPAVTIVAGFLVFVAGVFYAIIARREEIGGSIAAFFGGLKQTIRPDKQPSGDPQGTPAASNGNASGATPAPAATLTQQAGTAQAAGVLWRDLMTALRSYDSLVDTWRGAQNIIKNIRGK